MSTVPDDVRIDFSGMAEPWSAREATGMFLHVLEKGHRVAVYTTLVGMSDGGVASLIEHLDHFTRENPFCLHLPDAQDNMERVSSVSRVPRSRGGSPLVDDSLMRRRGNRGGLQMMTMSPNGRVHPAVADLLPRRLGHFLAQSRAGTVDEDRAAQVRHHYPVACQSTPSYDHNVVLPNGDVVLCCMDYGLSHPLGNLLSQPYSSLFDSDGMRSLVQANQLDGFDDATICKACSNAIRAKDPWLPPRRRPRVASTWIGAVERVRAACPRNECVGTADRSFGASRYLSGWFWCQPRSSTRCSLARAVFPSKRCLVPGAEDRSLRCSSASSSEGSQIAATDDAAPGSVVADDVPPDTIAVGRPARMIGSVSQQEASEPYLRPESPFAR